MDLFNADNERRRSGQSRRQTQYNDMPKESRYASNVKILMSFTLPEIVMV